jgi:hypothetical protein
VREKAEVKAHWVMASFCTLQSSEYEKRPYFLGHEIENAPHGTWPAGRRVVRLQLIVASGVWGGVR